MTVDRELDVREWTKTCSPVEFVLEGYWRFTGVEPETLRDALKNLIHRIKPGGDRGLAHAYTFCFSTTASRTWFEAIGSPELHAKAAEYAETYVPGIFERGN